MEFDEIVVKESPGLCRCCLSEGCYKDLGSEYPWMEDTEIYADMLLECFDISISQHNDGPNGPNRFICEVCITRLRDACDFKKQVLESEKKFVDMVGRGEFRPKGEIMQYPSQMKAEVTLEPAPDTANEVEYLDDDTDFGDDSYKDESIETSDVTATPLPAKGKRGRPRKSSVKADKKPKVAKVEEKPRTSKAVSKGFQIFSMLEDKTSEPSKRHALKALLTNILEGSTIMPFRWSANKYLCFYCCCSFVDSSKLKEHTRDEHKDANLRSALRNIRDFGHSRIKLDVSEISCKRCLKSIPSLQGYLEHSAEAHDVDFEKDIVNYLLSFKLSDDGMCCLECGQGFRFFGPLITHVHKYHNSTNAFLCEMCGQGFIAKSTLDSHVRMMHSNTDMQCDKCNKIFPSQYILNSHFSKTHRVETFRCSKCPEILKSRYLKKRHLAIVHDVKSTQFFCEHCDKMFTTKSALVQHVARVHLKEKSFACEVCGFKVFSRELLRQHMVKHDDARPFQCEFCKKSFQRKKTLDFHRRIHTNDRRYACKECGKAFVQVASLKLHLRVHHSIGNDNN